MRNLYRLALSAYIGLIILTLLWEGWLAPAPHFPPGFWLTFKSIPLLMPLFGLLHGKSYTYAWASMLILVYFVEGLVLAVSHRQEPFALHGVLPYALLEILLSTIFFFSAVFYVRQAHRLG
jgi:uncharacterized membrane protein